MLLLIGFYFYNVIITFLIIRKKNFVKTSQYSVCVCACVRAFVCVCVRACARTCLYNNAYYTLCYSFMQYIFANRLLFRAREAESEPTSGESCQSTLLSRVLTRHHGRPSCECRVLACVLTTPGWSVDR